MSEEDKNIAVSETDADSEEDSELDSDEGQELSSQAVQVSLSSGVKNPFAIRSIGWGSNKGGGVLPTSVEEAKGESSESGLWLLTFTDVMALMLTFFVLLYSMVAPDEQKWEEMTSAVTSQFKKYYSEEWQSGQLDTVSIGRIDFKRALNLDYLKLVIQESIDGQERLENVSVLQNKDNLVIALPHDLLFDAGATEVSEDGKRALFALAGNLSNIRNRIEVVGHAGTTSGRSTNWEESLTRAINVARILADVGYRKDLTVRGFPNDDGNEQTRSVDLVIMKDDGSMRRNFPNLGMD